MLRVLFVCLMVVISAYGHKLNVFTNVEENSLFIHAYFANGKGCKKCKVILEDKNRALSMESLTNDKGEVNFFVDKGTYALKVDAGSGHEITDLIKVSPMKKVVASADATLERENKQLKSTIASLQEQLKWMNILKTILAIVAIIIIFAFLKRLKQ